MNLAARIASAAAHPGQIVMSLETAQNVFRCVEGSLSLLPAAVRMDKQPHNGAVCLFSTAVLGWELPQSGV